MTDPLRYRLDRCGVLNVWQYDRQVFELADGRLLLRGANGAGKSKTMEMLLPFAIDGDKARLTASGRHHTSLLWLMLDGYEGQARTGYVWVEFSRTTADGERQTLTCGVGIRATQAARAASAWFFTSPHRVGEGLVLEDDAGPRSRQQLEADLADGRGSFFVSADRYREHVGRLLFGLPADQYDDLLRLIYWLRQPQVGEDIDPRRLAEQLVNALPQLDDAALRTAGSTFDELEAFGEQIEARARAAEALGRFVEVYRTYARTVLLDRGQALLDADGRLRAAVADQRRTSTELAHVRAELDTVSRHRRDAQAALDSVRRTIAALESGPQARARATLRQMALTVEALEARAGDAGRHRDIAAGRAGRSAAAAQGEATALTDRLGVLAAGVGDVARGLADAGIDTRAQLLATTAVLARPGGLLVWEDASAAAPLDSALAATHEWLAAADSSVVQRQAALTIVRDALDASVAARRVADEAGRRETDAQARTDTARDLLDLANADAATQEQAFRDAVSAWWLGGVGGEPPALDADNLPSLGALARRAVDDELTAHTTEVGRASADRDDANTEVADLNRRRNAVAAQADPHPAAPVWHRDPREGRPGAPFWRLVDFAGDLGAAERAGLEAALEGAGLLDAWVHPDGRVDAALLDAQLSAGSSAGTPPDGPAGPTVAAVLAPDSAGAESAGVAVGAVRDLLDRIGLVDGSPALDPARRPPVSVGTDGSWMAGPLHGRTTKEVAQFIGAGAREAERRRRLAELDAQIGDATGRAAAAEERRRLAQGRLDVIGEWLAGQPSHEALVRACAAAEERETVLARTEAELGEVASAARELRAEAAMSRRHLEALAATHELPVTDDGLRARAGRLADLRVVVDEHARTVDAATRDLGRWERLAGEARSDADEHAELDEAAAFAQSQWATQHAEHALLLDAEGEGVRELELRLASLRHDIDEHGRGIRDLGARHDDLTGRAGALGEATRAADERVEQARPEVDVARASLAALDDVAGFPESLAGLLHPVPTGSDDAVAQDDPSAAPGRLAGLSLKEVRDVVAKLGVDGDAGRIRNAVLQGATALQSSDAAAYEPRHFEDGGVLVVVGRDDGGDLPVLRLHDRLATAVARDRELLTTRERKLFEDHVLGQLGEALRAVRRKSDDLVEAMNEQLRGVTTSQGIRVRLRWKLRDDLAPEARRAVELLRQPLGSLLPDEKGELRDSLHRLIDASRAESPEESYAVHLARALDYRQWNAFTVQYHRPETGDWRDLQRRTALSQGEQKVLCYLPLFAAAAAHFTSVAGAAPHAPRFVLLDDAFPKIDVRTHPLLFGLLVQLDLDFVITSERLWGTHPTVPRLAIYEALRSPGERGIAQYQHRWDGHQLSAVGA